MSLQRIRLQKNRGAGNNKLIAIVSTAAAAAATFWLAKKTGVVQPPKRDTILALDLQHGYQETHPAMSIFQPKSLSHYELLKAIDIASKDKSVKGIVANVSPKSPLNLAQTEEIRNAIIKFKQNNKFAYCYADSIDNNTNYYLASGFDKILLAPPGDIGLTGLFLSQPFFRGLFDKLSILPQFIKRKQYKNAPDNFTESTFTAAHKESITSLATSLYDLFVDGISKGRNIPVDKVKDIIASGPYSAEEAKELGLVDELVYESEIPVKVKAVAVLQSNETKPKLLVTNKSDKDNNNNSNNNSDNNSDIKEKVIDLEPRTLVALLNPSIVRFHTYARRVLTVEEKKDQVLRSEHAPKIALIYGLGTVTNVSPGTWARGDEFYSSRLVKSIDAASKDPHVKSIVFRIDSPGGSYVASDVVYNALEKAKRSGKKIVISQASMAASGGYFASAPGDIIFANRSTITGSIGVFGGKFVLRDMFKEKLGVNWENISIGGNNGGLFSPMTPWNKFQWNKIEQEMDRIYNDFVTKVAEGRKLSLSQTETVAKGRVWTGEQALENKLVDQIGGLTEAIEHAKSFIPEPARKYAIVERFPRQQGLWAVLQREFGGEYDAEKDDQPLFDTPQADASAKTLITGAVLNELGLNNNTEIVGWIQDLSTILGNSSIQPVLKRVAQQYRMQNTGANNNGLTLNIEDSDE